MAEQLNARPHIVSAAWAIFACYYYFKRNSTTA